MTTPDPANFFSRLGSVIKREESQQQQKEQLLALWEIKSKSAAAHPRFIERGEAVAANLKGTPADCLMCQSLMDDLRWMLSRLD